MGQAFLIKVRMCLPISLIYPEQMAASGLPTPHPGCAGSGSEIWRSLSYFGDLLRPPRPELVDPSCISS